MAANFASLLWWQCSIYCWRFKSVCKLFFSEDRQEAKSKCTHSLHCIFEKFYSGTRTKDKTSLANINILNYFPRFDNSSIFVELSKLVKILIIYEIFDQMACLKMNLVSRY